MAETNRTGALILGGTIAVGLAALGYLLADAALAVKSLERTVTVKGLSERELPADVATWPVTFQVASNDLDDVYQSIESKANTVKSFLVGYGIGEDDISLSPPNVVDLLAQQWGDKSNIQFRYTGNASVTVYSQNVPAVRAAMANMLELGKQGVVVSASQYPGAGGNEFLFTKLNDVKPAMIEEATRNARSVAEKFAADSNSRLGKIKSARQGQFSIENRDATTPHIKKVRVVSTVVYYLAD